MLHKHVGSKLSSAKILVHFCQKVCHSIKSEQWLFMCGEVCMKNACAFHPHTQHTLNRQGSNMAL